MRSAHLAIIRDTSGELDVEAAAVVARLSTSGYEPDITAAEARRRYAQSRRALLAAPEAVAEAAHVRPTAPGVPSLTLFRPFGSAPNELLPALIFLHGGGWTLGDLETYEPLVRALANATGSVVVWVDYRLAPESPFPAGLDDAWRAAAWVQANARSLGIDRNQIGIGGDSAGGNLAAVTALAARDRKIVFEPAYQLLMYPCLDLTANAPSHDLFADGYLLTAKLYAWYRRNYLCNTNPVDWRVSPIFASSFSDVAPAIILYGGFDPLRDEAIDYAKRLKGSDVTVESMFFPGQIHGFLNMGGAISAASVAIERIGVCVREMLSRGQAR